MTEFFEVSSPRALPRELDEEKIEGDMGFGIYRDLGKQVFDVSLVLAASVLVVPLVLCLALIVALDGHNPFYTQRRVGRDGRVFRMLKLRSMVCGAEAALENVLAADPDAAAEWARDQKLRNDPRITRFGSALRRTSMDELPQLWNVLRGDMALVGPRPIMENQRDMYTGNAYYMVRPGVTGLWQTASRNAATFATRVEYDQDYVARLSFLLDLRILARTCLVVIRRTGC